MGVWQSLMNLWDLLGISIDIHTVLVFTIALLSLYWLLGNLNTNNRPPGPWKWPVIGNLNVVVGNRFPPATFRDLAKKYGDVYSLQLGRNYVVVLNSEEVIADAYANNGEHFGFRPCKEFFMVQQLIGPYGIFMSEGETWRQVRKFAVTTLRDFGVGKKTLEERIQQEAVAVMEVFDKQEGKPFAPRSLMADSVSNVICSIVFGNRFEFDDPKFNELVKMLQFLFDSGILNSPVNFLPWTRFLLRNDKALKMIEINKKLYAFVRERVREHEATFDPENIRDFVDMYIETKRKGSRMHDTISEENTFRVILDLFFAGTDTTSNTVTWMIIFLLNNPRVMEKVHEEIDRVIGPDRPPALSDKPNLPYIQATMTELWRRATIAPIAAPHVTNRDKDIVFHGYTIPAGSVILANIFAVHMNPQTWPNPMEFRPERHLDENGQFVKPVRGFMPFSVGRRSCLGEPLSRMETFLFFTTFFQQFKFSIPEGATLPSPDSPSVGVTVTPPPFEVCVTRR